MNEIIISCAKALSDNGFQVSTFETGTEARNYLLKELEGVSVGFGGSLTLKQLGLYEALSEKNTVTWHWIPEDGLSVPELRKKAAASDVYFTSANAIAETGEIINIDGSGNRVAAATFGCKKVYIVAGVNKIAPDFEKALYRARNVAAPKNAQKLGRKTPCAEKGDRCYNCQSPERICNALSVFWKKPSGCAYEVLLINEELGL